MNTCTQAQFLSYISQLFLVLHLICFFKHVESRSQVAGGNCDHPSAKYKFGGNNMGFGLSVFASSVKPAIFPCTWDSGGAKWLRFRVTKQRGVLAEDDLMLVVLSSGIECEEGSSIDPSKINEQKILCDLKKADVSCPVQNFRVADAISDPFESTVCVIAFCMNKRLGCEAEIQVEFYDRMYNILYIL